MAGRSRVARNSHLFSIAAIGIHPSNHPSIHSSIPILQELHTMQLLNIIFAGLVTLSTMSTPTQAQPGDNNNNNDESSTMYYDDIIGIDAATFNKFLQDPTKTWFDVVVDVRTNDEWEAGHIANATLVENLASYTNETADRTGGTPSALAGCEHCNIVVYCQSGSRAAAALQVLRAAGFVGRLYNGQGVSQWTAAGFLLETTPESVTPPCTVDAAVSEQCRQAYLEYTAPGNPTTTTNSTAVPLAAPTSLPSAAPLSDTVSDNSTTPATGGNTTDPMPVRPGFDQADNFPSPAPSAVPSGSLAPFLQDEKDSSCEANSRCMASNLTGLCCPSKFALEKIYIYYDYDVNLLLTQLFCQYC